MAPTWLASTNGVIHPDAPQGGGGAGFFRAAGVFVSDGDVGALPHPDSPAAAGMDPVQLQQAQALQAAAAKRQPPPRVLADSTQVIRGITVKILKDELDVADAGDAITDMTEADGHAGFGGNIGAFVFTLTPWTVTIQTKFGTGKPDDDSAYGRGTTPGDIAAGNVTLGFHESCHRKDMISYLTNTPLPAFTGKPKMTTDEANAAVAKYQEDCLAYFAAGRAGSVAATDETADAKVKKSQMP